MELLESIWSEYIYTPQGGMISFVIAVASVVGMWLLFRKAHKAGWRSLIPILNIYTLCQIADRGWKVLLLLIPGVGVVYYVLLNFRLARAFGRGLITGLGLILLPWLFTILLGLGDAEYERRR